MKRYVYAFETSAAAMAAVDYLSSHGIDKERVSLIARSDISEKELPDGLIDVSMDFAPAIKRGALFGAATGLVIGIVVPLVPAVGLSISAFELIAFVIGGALIGTWSASMIGAEVPNKLRRTFQDEIDAGRTLVVIQSESDSDVKIIDGMATTGNRHLVWQSDSDRVPEMAP
jgi:hypothetical protein